MPAGGPITSACREHHAKSAEAGLDVPHVIKPKLYAYGIEVAPVHPTGICRHRHALVFESRSVSELCAPIGASPNSPSLPGHTHIARSIGALGGRRRARTVPPSHCPSPPKLGGACAVRHLNGGFLQLTNAAWFSNRVIELM